MLGDLLAKVAKNEPMDYSEIEQLRRYGNEIELVASGVANLNTQTNQLTGDMSLLGTLYSENGVDMGEAVLEDTSSPYGTNQLRLAVGTDVTGLPSSVNAALYLQSIAPAGLLSDITATARDGSQQTSLHISSDGLIEMYGQIYLQTDSNGLGGIDTNNKSVRFHAEVAQATDTAISFIPSRTSGAVLTCFLDDGGVWGLFGYDVSAPTCQKNTGGGAFVTSTSVLTGTTGGANQFTVSANGGQLYFENRRGGARTWYAILF